MAARKLTGELPPGGVIISEEEAVKHQWRLIMNWTPSKDVWIFRHGLAIIVGGTALSAIYINNYYRNKLHLANFGRVASFLPIVVIPSIVSVVFHQQFVSADVIIQKQSCPICLQMRAAGIQAFVSVAYPVILAPLQGFTFAIRHYTYNVPSLLKEPRESLKLWSKLTRPAGNIFFSLCVAQAFLAMGVTYFEEEAILKVQNKWKVYEERQDSQ